MTQVGRVTHPITLWLHSQVSPSYNEVISLAQHGPNRGHNPGTALIAAPPLSARAGQRNAATSSLPPPKPWTSTSAGGPGGPNRAETIFAPTGRKCISPPPWAWGPRRVAH